MGRHALGIPGRGARMHRARSSIVDRGIRGLDHALVVRAEVRVEPETALPRPGEEAEVLGGQHAPGAPAAPHRVIVELAFARCIHHPRQDRAVQERAAKPGRWHWQIARPARLRPRQAMPRPRAVGLPERGCRDIEQVRVVAPRAVRTCHHWMEWHGRRDHQKARSLGAAGDIERGQPRARVIVDHQEPGRGGAA